MRRVKRGRVFFSDYLHKIRQMTGTLSKINVIYYRVKHGQTLAAVAAYFGVPCTLIVKENGLKQAPFEGQILKIPKARGHLYTAQAGDGKTLLCGSEENYKNRNGTTLLYPGLKVFL